MKKVDLNAEIVVFKPSQGSNEFEIILDGEHETVWVTEQQLVELFGKARRTIGDHIRNIYKEGELEKESTWRNFRQVQKEGERKVKRAVSAYNLDVVCNTVILPEIWTRGLVKKETNFTKRYEKTDPSKIFA